MSAGSLGLDSVLGTHSRRARASTRSRSSSSCFRATCSIETVDWLATRHIGLFGTDFIQVDDPDEWWYPTHTSLARNGIPMVQQLCSLDRLEGKEFVFLVVPLKLRGGTASPVRPIALVTRR